MMILLMIIFDIHTDYKYSTRKHRMKSMKLMTSI